MINIQSRILLFLAFMLPFSLLAQQRSMPLSENATASVITCGPGNEFYTSFGHSAIRICDTAAGIDLVYNYGTFDFDTPHFYLKFAQGKLNYCLSRTSFSNFLMEYEYEQRSVYEQKLNLSSAEVANLFLLLEQNYRPEMRYYKYDFFKDNCATRIRDMIIAAAGHDKIVLQQPAIPTSFRSYINSSTKNTLEWWQLGINILFGAPADHRCTSEEAMFLPKVMMDEYAIATKNGQPLVTTTMQHLSDTHQPLHTSFPPLVVFALLLVIIASVSAMGWKRRWDLRWMDRILFFLAGLAGLFLCLMWFGTDHYCTKWNYNLLWASPLFILIAIKLEHSPRWAIWLHLGMQATFIVLAAIFGIYPLIPLTLTLGIRCYAQLKN